MKPILYVLSFLSGVSIGMALRAYRLKSYKECLFFLTAGALGLLVVIFSVANL